MIDFRIWSKNAMLYVSYKRLKDTTTIVSISHEINFLGFSLPRAHRWFLRQQVS